MIRANPADYILLTDRSLCRRSHGCRHTRRPCSNRHPGPGCDRASRTRRVGRTGSNSVSPADTQPILICAGYAGSSPRTPGKA